MHYVRNSSWYRWYKLGRAKYALSLHGNPGTDLQIIGITGTDGKTTTSTILHHCLMGLGYSTMMIGTNGVMINGKPLEGVEKMTSYDPLDLQKLLAYAIDHEVTHVVLEVSSHGLDQYRFYGIPFRAAVLTNIAAEHLDYHRTIDEYADAKKKLFKQLQHAGKYAIAVFPSDDQYGRKWADEMQFKTELTYGLSGSAKLLAKNIVLGPTSTTYTIEHSARSVSLTTGMIGEFNVRNTLAAMSVCVGLGHTIQEVAAAMEGYKQATGRQKYVAVGGVHWYIDFAHTPQGLEAMLKTLRSIKGEQGRVMCVFGTPGKRDKAKRPVMAETVERYTDVMIITDDDASSENRWDILHDVMSGVTRQLGDNYYMIPDRGDAIAHACRLAAPGDVVLLAGKGHEEVLVTNFGKRMWDEEKVLKEERKIVNS